MKNDRIIERTKIKILQILSDPSNAESGKAAENLKGIAQRARRQGEEQLTTPNIVIPDMVASGLIERREGLSDLGAKAKPYFITDIGRKYPLDATAKAMSTEPGNRDDWAVRDATYGVRETVANFIRRLPEFQTRSEERIQQVSRELAEMLSQLSK
jgi:hypothetical protein